MGSAALLTLSTQGKSTVKIPHHSKGSFWPHYHFTEPTTGQGGSEKPPFPSLPHGCRLLQLRQ